MGFQVINNWLIQWVSKNNGNTTWQLNGMAHSGGDGGDGNIPRYPRSLQGLLQMSVEQSSTQEGTGSVFSEMSQEVLSKFVPVTQSMNLSIDQNPLSWIRTADFISFQLHAMLS